MQWDDHTREGLDVALNESEILGVRLEPSGAWCDLLIHVLALPVAGPTEPDARRILRLKSPTQVTVLLRTDETTAPGYGPAIPLHGLDAVEEFLASLSWSGSMYGWRFLDEPSLTHDWPARPSFTIDIRSPGAAHGLYWFNECGRHEGATKVAYCLEGTIAFEDLAVLRADATPQPLYEFMSDAQRYWHALRGGDERLSVEAQRAAQDGAPSWRPYVRHTVRIGSPGDAEPD